MRRPTRSTLFPYTTLFRSKSARAREKMEADTVTADVEEPPKVGSKSDLSKTDVPKEVAQTVPRTELKADRKSTRLNSSHTVSSYAVFCLKKKTTNSVRIPR